MDLLTLLLPVILFCGAATASDIRLHRIPNALNLAGLASGLCLSWIRGGAAGLKAGLAGVCLGVGLLLIPFLLRMVGGGDVKFLAAAGAMLGWRLLWPSFLAGAALGGVLALVAMTVKSGSVGGAYSRVVLLLSGCISRAGAGGRGEVRLPYAAPLSAGLLLVTAASLIRGSI